METWDIRSLAIEPHQPQVLRSDAETRAIAICSPPARSSRSTRCTRAPTCSSSTARSRSRRTAQSTTGGSGLLSHFEPNERRTVKAISDARLVLVLAPWPGEGHPSLRVA